jgi:trimethylamine:corrinoid methyltransferase-like protein
MAVMAARVVMEGASSCSNQSGTLVGEVAEVLS